MKHAIVYLDAKRPEVPGLLAGVFDRMVAEDLLSRVFYDGSVQNGEQFLAEVLRPGSLPFAIMAGDEVACFTWLNSIEGRSARGHFVFFRKFWGRKTSVPIGRRYFGYILTLRDQGGYLFDSVVGITPRANALSWKFALQCGCALVGTLPRFAWLANRGESADAVAVAATRECLGLADGQAVEGIWDA